VVPVERELPLRREVREQRRDVARVELARVRGHRARQVERSDDLDSVNRNDLAGLRQLAVAAGLGGEVDDDRAGPHALDRRRRNEAWGGSARDRGGRDHRVELRDPLFERLLLALLLLRRQLARVATLGLLADDAEVEERRAERLHLLAHRGTDVEAEDDGAAAAGRRGRLPARRT